MSALEERLVCFHGGPCDGGVEAVDGDPPPAFAFSSARIDGEWHNGSLRVADVLYVREPGDGPVLHYRLAGA